MKHLTESEIQSLLDRENRQVTTIGDASLREHVDNCLICRLTAEDYNLLYDELDEQPEVSLSAGFAQRVIAALPSTRLVRLPSVIETLSGLSVVLAACLVWLMVRIPWLEFLTWSMSSTTSSYSTLKAWSHAVTGMVPALISKLPSIPIPDMTVDLSIFERMTESMISNSGTVHFLIFAAIAILLIGSVDRLLTVELWNRKSVNSRFTSRS